VGAYLNTGFASPLVAQVEQEMNIIRKTVTLRQFVDIVWDDIGK